MSGAEAIAVISIIANALQLLDFSAKALARVKSFTGDVTRLPKAFQRILILLPLITNTLQVAHDQTTNGDLSGSSCKALCPAIETCRDKVLALNEILENMLPKSSEPTWKKAGRAIASMAEDKRVQEIYDALAQNLNIISHHQTAWVASQASITSKLIQNVSDTVNCMTHLLPEPVISLVPRKKYFMASNFISEDFTGRDDIMQQLDEILSGQPDKHRRAALIGLGGIGKTRILLEYTQRVKSSTSRSIFWIHASTLERVKRACSEIAKEVKIDGWDHPTTNQFDIVAEWLRSTDSGDWLLILDNADDITLFYGSGGLAALLPRSDNGVILMTTRNAQVGRQFAARNSITVKALSTLAASDLLVARLPDQFSTSDERERLADELGCIPLALVQASAFMAHNYVGVDEYLEMYSVGDVVKIEFLSQDFEDDSRDADTKNPVAATWNITFEHIRQTATMAAEMLSMMSMLDPQAIPESLLPFKENFIKFKKALGTLQSFSLITARNDSAMWQGRADKSYDLHRLVRLAMRSWLVISQSFDKWTANALEAVAQEFPDGLWELKDLWTVYLPHATTILAISKLNSKAGELPDVFRGQTQHLGACPPKGVICPLCTAKLLAKVARCHSALGQHRIALAEAERALVLRRRFLGDDHLDTLQTYDLVALPAKVLNHFERAVSACLQGIEAKSRTLGPEHPSTLTSMTQLAMTYRPMGKPNQAKEMMLRVLDIRQRILGDLDPDTMQAVTVLASSRRALGEYAEAEILEIANLRRKTEVQGLRVPSTTQTMACLAWIIACQGRYREAQELNAKAIGIQIDMVGEAHHLPLWATNNMAIMIGMQGRYNEALTLAEKVYKLRQQALGPKHPFTYGTLLYTSWLYNELGKVDEAIPICLEVLAFQKDFYGDEKHPEVLLTKSQLASSYTYQARHDLAEPLKVEALETRKISWPVDHPTTLRCQVSLGLTYSELGRLADAEQLIEEAWVKQKRILGDIHPEALTSMTRLATVYVYQGRAVEARNLLRDVSRMSSEVLGSEHPRTIARVLSLQNAETRLAMLDSPDVPLEDLGRMALVA